MAIQLEPIEIGGDQPRIAFARLDGNGVTYTQGGLEVALPHGGELKAGMLCGAVEAGGGLHALVGWTVSVHNGKLVICNGANELAQDEELGPFKIPLLLIY